MKRFEEQLKEALLRREPSHDFVRRVLEKTEEQQARLVARAWSFRRAWTWRLVPVMTALLLLSAGAMYYENQRAVRGEMAKEKLLIAVRIAGSKLHNAQQHVMDIQDREVER